MRMVRCPELTMCGIVPIYLPKSIGMIFRNVIPIALLEATLHLGLVYLIKKYSPI